MPYDKSKTPNGVNYQQPIYQPPDALLDDEPEHKPAVDSRVVIGSCTARIGERNHFSTKPRAASDNLGSALKPFFG